MGLALAAAGLVVAAVALVDVAVTSYDRCRGAWLVVIPSTVATICAELVVLLAYRAVAG